MLSTPKRFEPAPVALHRVVYGPAARQDLLSLFAYINLRSGPERANAYVHRIEDFCQGLSRFPERGTRRDDLQSGLRTVGFERRVTVGFAIDGDRVVIVRILYGGRNLAAAFVRE